MSLHTREKIFGFGATPKIPPIKAVQEKCGAAKRPDANVSALEFSSSARDTRSRPFGPQIPCFAWSIGPLGHGSQHMMRRPEYCGIGRGGLFFKDSLPFLDSLWPYREILSSHFLRTDLASSVRTSKPRPQYFKVRPRIRLINSESY